MTDPNQVKKMKPVATVEFVTELDQGALQDLCDATDEAVRGGGGFGWIKVPARDIIERYWKGVLTMPARFLFVAKLDGVICGTAQLMTPPRNNEAQSFSVSLTANFIAPWARGHGLARMLLDAVEQKALAEGYSVINLDVRETQEAAISLYEKHGYIKIGTHPCYARVDGKIIRGFYYYKVIDSAALLSQQ
jgi:ribosomal protein S18 acetylase RimI-like enzyme